MSHLAPEDSHRNKKGKSVGMLWKGSEETLVLSVLFATFYLQRECQPPLTGSPVFDSTPLLSRISLPVCFPRMHAPRRPRPRPQSRLVFGVGQAELAPAVRWQVSAHMALADSSIHSLRRDSCPQRGQGGLTHAKHSLQAKHCSRHFNFMGWVPQSPPFFR